MTNMKKLYAFLTAAVMALLFPLSAAAVAHYDPNVAELTYSDAPEGTVYMDILIKMGTDDQNYVAFTQPPQYYTGRHTDESGTDVYDNEPLPVSAESEIARYNEDGYVSLSLHHKKAESLTIFNSAHNTELSENTPHDRLIMHSTAQVSSDFIDLSINYGAFKAAYVDEDGNILGVTNVSETAYSTKTPYGFSANGNSLTFQRHGAHPAVISVVVFLTGLVIISLPIVITFIYRRRSRRMKVSEVAERARKNLK